MFLLKDDIKYRDVFWGKRKVNVSYNKVGSFLISKGTRDELKWNQKLAGL